MSVWVAGAGYSLYRWTLGNRIRELKESESWLSLSTLVSPSGTGDMGHGITRHWRHRRTIDTIFPLWWEGVSNYRSVDINTFSFA